MPDPITKTLSQLIAGQVAAIQAQAAGLVDFSIGSILRAVAEANAQVALWLEGLILTLLAVIRAATATGADLDSWMADFGLRRLLAIVAQGFVTFSRFSTGTQVVVPIGSQISSADGSQAFSVTVDLTNPAYNAGLGGYVMPGGTATVTVPAVAVTPGAAGNVAANVVTLITSTLPGVDLVNNASGFTGGADAETDPAFRARFVLFLASLSKATIAAIKAVVLALGSTVSVTVQENLTYAGQALAGYFFVVVDDGSGAPTGGFLATAQNAVEATRAAGITYGVYGPVLTTVNIAATVGIIAGYDGPTVRAAVQAALQAYVNGLGLGVGLSYTRLIQVAYDATPGVYNVTGMLINAGTADIAGNVKNSLKPGTVVIS